MREIRMSGSMRGGRKRAFARRACLLLYGVPQVQQSLLAMDGAVCEPASHAETAPPLAVVTAVLVRQLRGPHFNT